MNDSTNALFGVIMAIIAACVLVSIISDTFLFWIVVPIAILGLCWVAKALERK